jgi:hypothetical protein
MAVTLYRQVGKGKARRYQKVNLGRGRAVRPTSPVPTSCGIRSPMALVHGKRLATTSTRQSTLHQAQCTQSLPPTPAVVEAFASPAPKLNLVQNQPLLGRRFVANSRYL